MIARNTFNYYRNAFKTWRAQIKEYNHLKKLLKGVKREQIIKKTFVFNIVTS